MMKEAAMRRRGALLLAGIAAFALPALADVPSGIGALQTLERGRWHVRELDGATPAADLCLGDATQLLRFEHRSGPTCSLEVLESGPRSGTVQYSCASRGFGHSQIRVETPRTVRIDTQGMSGGKPFSYRLEARRVGTC